VTRTLGRSYGLAALAAGTASACPAWAHAFGQRYDLPLPLWLYTTSAGAVVALSFVIAAVFIKARHSESEPPAFDLMCADWFDKPTTSFLLNGVRVLSVAGLVLILAACFGGTTDPLKNFAPTFVWVVWWVGLAFVSALIGNLWDLINPWQVVFGWMRSVVPTGNRPRRYPEGLGAWPAVILYFIFAWMELISEFAEQPRVLGGLILAYSLITWLGMACYGRDAWLRNGEVFTVAFGLLARFAPCHGSSGRLILRWPTIGLLTREPMAQSYVFFVLLLLTSVTFDGILETPFWHDMLEGISESQPLRPTLLQLQGIGINLLMLIKTIALLGLPAIFWSVYVAFCCGIKRAAGSQYSLQDIAGYFVLSLVPIAIAYHLSHYLSYLLLAGQNIIPLASDPLGLGWDLFGTAGYRMDIGIINAKMVWYVAVTAIVLGHLAAVFVAHVTAIRIFKSTRAALLSQIPMLALMVAYTMVSLWILSQPIVA
jgi:hypothetical protein